MDSACRLIIKRNAKLIKSLDINILKKPLLKSRIFTNAMIKDIYAPDSNYELFSELPSRGPLAFSRFLDVLVEAGYVTEAEILKNGPKNVESSKQKSVFYSMKSEPLGYCLIINNIKFDHFEKRVGSDVDARNLQQLFKKLNYDVYVEEDLTGKDIKRFLNGWAKSKKLKDVDSFVLIILSHGFKNAVHGTDSYEIEKDWIYQTFDNVNCTYLKNKPKLFIFQACRGDNEDPGVESADSPSKVYSRNSFENTDAVSATTVDATPLKSNDFKQNTLKKDPTLNDVIIVHSSLPDHKAYRDHFLGSWLIQDLNSVFSRDYLEQDVDNMLKTVSRNLQERLTLRHQMKQVLHTENRGIRALLHLCSNEDYNGCEESSREYLFCD